MMKLLPATSRKLLLFSRRSVRSGETVPKMKLAQIALTGKLLPFAVAAALSELQTRRKKLAEERCYDG